MKFELFLWLSLRSFCHYFSVLCESTRCTLLLMNRPQHVGIKGLSPAQSQPFEMQQHHLLFKPKNYQLMSHFSAAVWHSDSAADEELYTHLKRDLTSAQDVFMHRWSANKETHQWPSTCPWLKEIWGLSHVQEVVYKEKGPILCCQIKSLWFLQPSLNLQLLAHLTFSCQIHFGSYKRVIPHRLSVNISSNNFLKDRKTV